MGATQSRLSSCVVACSVEKSVFTLLSISLRSRRLRCLRTSQACIRRASVIRAYGTHYGRADGMNRFTWAAMALLCAALTHAEVNRTSACVVQDGLEPICGLRGSEDIEVLPHERQLLVSQSRVAFDKNS